MSRFKTHLKRNLAILMALVILVVSLVAWSIALFTDRVNQTVTFTIATFSKDGYTLERTAPSGYFVAGESVTATIKESNAKDEPVDTVISMSATWDSPIPDCKIWGNAAAEDNATLTVGGSPLDYTVEADGSISFELPLHTLGAQVSEVSRELTLNIPSSLTGTGSLSFSFDGATVSQTPSGWSNTYSKEELNETEDLGYTVGIGWNISEDQSTKDVMAYLADAGSGKYQLVVIKNGQVANTNRGKMMDFTIDKSNDGSSHTNTTTYWSTNSPWYSYKSEITDVSLPDGLTTIGAGAFIKFRYWDCAYTIPDTVVSIGEGAFGNCSALSAITIPDSVEEIGECAFGHCESIKTITLGSGLTKLANSVFLSNNSLERIDWGIDCHITEIGDYAFRNAGQTNGTFTSLSFPDSVRVLGVMSFRQALGLANLDLNQVEVIKARAFDSAHGMKALTIPANVKFIGELAFYENLNLADITFEHSPSDPLSLPIPQNYTSESGEYMYAGAFRLYNTVVKTDVHHNQIPVLEDYIWIDDNRWVKGEPVLQSWSDTAATDFHAYKSTATKITVMDHYDPPEYISHGPWDVSAAKDESVMAYMVGTEVFICSNVYSWYDPAKNQNANVIANENSSYLFYQFNQVKEINLAAFDTSQTKNMACMFKECSSLPALDVGNFDTRNVQDMSEMFRRCRSILALDLSNWDMSTVRNVSTMFNSCEACTSLKLSTSENSMASVELMSGMFYDCWVLPTVDLSNFHTGNVKDMWGMFAKCYALSSLDLSSFDTRNVETMGSMFSGCTSLSSLDLSNFETDRLNYTGYMFAGSDQLKTLDLKNFNTTGVTDMMAMFRDCSRLESIDVSNFVTSNVTNMNEMFYRCNGLLSLDLTSFTIGSNTTASAILFECQNLSTLTLGAGINNFNAFKARDLASLTTINFKHKAGDSVSFPEAGAQKGAFYVSNLVMTTINTENSTIAQYDWIADNRQIFGEPVLQNFSKASTEAFRPYQGTATKITVMDHYAPPSTFTDGPWDVSEAKDKSVMAYVSGTEIFICSNVGRPAKVIANEDSSFLFYDFNQVTEIDAENLDTSRAVNMDCMFASVEDGTMAVQTIKASSWDTQKVQRMEYMFSGCKNLTTLDVSLWNTGSVYTMTDMFAFCHSIQTLSVAKWDVRKVENFNWLFYECKSLTTIPVSQWDTQSMTTCKFMFCGCENLLGLNVSGFKTGSCIDMSYMFANCKNLRNIDVSNFVTTQVKNFCDMFSDCTSLQSIDVTGFITSAATKVSYMFNACDALKELDLSSFDLRNVTTYENAYHIVGDCIGLETLTIGRGIKDFTIFKARHLEKLKTISFNHTADDTVVFPTAGDSDGAFYTPTLVPTVINTQNTTVQQYDWRTDNRTIVGEPVLQAFANASTEAFRPYQDTATKITVMDHYDPPTTFTDGPWDVSEAQDESVMAYLSGTEIFICSNVGSPNVKVIANEDSSFLFYDFNQVTEIDAENLDTSRAVNMDCMFASAENGTMALETVLASSWETDSVERMEYMFSGCESLTTLDVSKWNTSKVYTMTDMFAFCRSIETLDVSEWDVSSLQNYNWLFHECDKLTSIPVDNWDTANMETAQYLFSGCDALQSINVSGFDTSKATLVARMFENCTSLTSLDLSSFDLSLVPSEDNAFNIVAGCSNLETLTIGVGIKDFTVFKARDLQKLTTINFKHGPDDTVALPTPGSTYGAFYTPTLVITSINTQNDAIKNYNWVTDNRSAAVPHALLYDDGSMVFQYGNTPAPGKTLIGDWTGFESTEYPDATLVPWYGMREQILSVSFADKISPFSTQWWFEGASNMTSFNGTNLDTSNTTNMRKMFYLCGSLISLDLTMLNTANVESMQQMFNGCSNLETIQLSTWNTEKVQNFGATFAECPKLKSLDTAALETDSAIHLRDMFWDCESISTLDVSTWNTANVENMWGVFTQCDNLERIIGLENWHTGNTTSMAHMFGRDPKLTSLDLSSFDTSKIATADDIYEILVGCDSLQTLTIGRGIKDFTLFQARELPALTTINFNHTADDTVTLPTAGSTDGAFYVSTFVETVINTQNSAIKEYDWGADNRGTSQAMLGTQDSWYKSTTVDRSAITEIVFADTYAPTGPVTDSWDASYDGHGGVTAYVEGTKLTIVGDGSGSILANEDSIGVFYQFTGLEKIDLAIYDTSTATAIDSMFDDCTSLVSLDLSTFDTSHVTGMADLFSDCTSLTSLTLGENFDTSQVTDMGGMFGGCSSLPELDVSMFDTSKVTSMVGMFGRVGIKNLDLSNFNTDSVTGMAFMFSGSEAIETLNVSNFITDEVTSMSHMFYYCKNLKTPLNLSTRGKVWDTSQVTDMENMFWECSSLPSLDVSGWNTAKVTNMARMFRDCMLISSLDISSFDTNAITSSANLDSFAHNCTQLTTIHLGPNFGQNKSLPKAGSTSGMFFVGGPLETTITGANSVMTSYRWTQDNRSISSAVESMSLEFDPDTGTIGGYDIGN